MEFYPPPKGRDLTGRKIPGSYWEVLGYAGGSRWWCRCRCGTVKVVGSCNLLGGAVRSCGCQRKVRIGERYKDAY
jgi:hypothetical protein